MQIVSSPNRSSFSWCGRITRITLIFGVEHYQVKPTNVGVAGWFPREALRTVVPAPAIICVNGGDSQGNLEYQASDTEHNKGRDVRSLMPHLYTHCIKVSFKTNKKRTLDFTFVLKVFARSHVSLPPFLPASACPSHSQAQSKLSKFPLATDVPNVHEARKELNHTRRLVSQLLKVRQRCAPPLYVGGRL